MVDDWREITRRKKRRTVDGVEIVRGTSIHGTSRRTPVIGAKVRESRDQDRGTSVYKTAGQGTSQGPSGPRTFRGNMQRVKSKVAKGTSPAPEDS